MDDDHRCQGEACDKKSERLKTEPMMYHGWYRCDYWSIYTGMYCDDCYENNYPYRRDNYELDDVAF